MYTEELIKRLSEKTGIDISKFDMNELVMGMNVELEHGSSNNKTDVTGDDPEATFKIVVAHMHEMPDYYTRLKKMEKKENISEYARRMRELAGLSEGNQKKTLKTIQEGNSSFEEGATFYAKDMMGESKGKDEELENPEKADLDDDGELSAYEKKRGKAVEKAMKKESINESEEKEEFETHKFEQKTIEEGENDEELYTLNENTIIVLDFLNEGFYEDDDEFAERDALMAELEKMYPDAWFKESERFQGHGGGIWTGEGSYDKEGREIFSYWSNSPDYEIGVLKSFNDFIESKGFWAEWQDAGTIMIWPK